MKQRFSVLIPLIMIVAQTATAQPGWSTIFSALSHSGGVIQSSSGTLLLGTHDNGLYRSGDDGATFEFVQGFGCKEYFVALSETPSGVLYMLTDADLYRSDDDGLSWNICDLRKGILSSNPTAMAALGDTMLVASFIGMWRSTDGIAWDTVSRMSFGSMATLGNGSVVGKNSAGVFRSTDAGVHWELIGGEALPWNATLCAGRGSTVFAWDGLAYRSDDGGAHWEPVDAFRYMIGKQNVVVHTDGTILHNVSGVLYISKDDGVTWAKLPAAPDACGQGVLYIDRQGRIYADYHVGKIIRSDRSITAADQVGEPIMPHCDLLPNPSHGNPTLSVTLPRAASVRVSVTDALGRVVRDQETHTLEAGTRHLSLHTNGLPPGAYYIMVAAPDFVNIERLLLLP